MVEAKAIAARPRLPMEAEAACQGPAIETKTANKNIRRVSTVALHCLVIFVVYNRMMKEARTLTLVVVVVRLGSKSFHFSGKAFVGFGCYMT